MDLLDVFVAVSVIVFVFLALLCIIYKVSKSAGKRTKPKQAILLSGLKKLSQNPNDVKALFSVGQIYIEQKSWENAFSVYTNLISRSSQLLPSQQLEINKNYGIAALNTKRLNEAKERFLLARTIDQEDFDINYNLAYVYYLEGEYDKAIPFFGRCLILNSENFKAKKYLGLSYRKTQNFNDAIQYLNAAFTIVPDDKEVLFTIGECFFELGMTDKALKVFYRLRTDPSYGAESCLYSGILHMKMSQYENAIQDFEIGLKHSNITDDVKCEIYYQYAQSYIKLKNISKAIDILNQIQKINPTYKDISQLIETYAELNQNVALRIYLMASQNDFVALCRKIVTKFFPMARVKIVDISVLSTHTDVTALLDMDRFTDTALFRFFRTQGSVGELSLRDFHEKLKELKAGTGVCCCAGDFTNEAIKFSEGRPIELYPKERLNKLLSKIN